MHVKFKNLFFQKSYRFLDNVEKYGQVRQGTDDRWHMHIVWFDNRLQAHTQNAYVIIVAFHGNSVCTNVPQCYILCAFRLLFLGFMCLWKQNS